MYYAGIDAHLTYLVIAAVDKSGTLVLEERVSNAEPKRLLGVLEPYRPLEAVVETCQFWPWIHDLLVPAGIGFHRALQPAHRLFPVSLPQEIAAEVVVEKGLARGFVDRLGNLLRVRSLLAHSEEYLYLFPDIPDGEGYI